MRVLWLGLQTNDESLAATFRWCGAVEAAASVRLEVDAPHQPQLSLEKAQSRSGSEPTDIRHQTVRLGDNQTF